VPNDKIINDESLDDKIMITPPDPILEEPIIIEAPESIVEEPIIIEPPEEINESLPSIDQVEIVETKQEKPKKSIREMDAKGFFHLVTSIFLYSIMAILGIIFIMFVAYFVDQKIGQAKGQSRAPLFGAYVIISESMVPKINVNDAVITMRVSEKHIHKNDIITFLSKDIETMGTPITHRVVGIVYEDKDNKKVLGYRTKGDNNNTQDFALIKPDEVLGKVYLRLPKVGYLQSFLTKPSGWLLLIVLPCFLIIGNDIYKIVKKTKEE